jgi:hypothetical protein
MRINETKIKLNRIQIIALMMAALIFLCLFVAQAFFEVRTGYSPMVAIIVALFLFLYLAREKNAN